MSTPETLAFSGPVLVAHCAKMQNETSRNLLSVALNPSLQKSLLFGDKAWKALEVNRATESWTQIGGKGQTFGCAATKFKNTQVAVVQFLGGTTGQIVEKMLNERRPPSQLRQQIENKCDREQEGPTKYPLGNLEQVTVWLEGDTRICTTLLCSNGMTEMIEPAVHVPAPKVRELLSKLTMRLLGQNRHPTALPVSAPQGVKAGTGVAIESPDSNSGSEDETTPTNKQRRGIDCVSINGSFPPGITLMEVCGTLASALKQMCPRPVVLCDAYLDVEKAISNPTTASVIDILKINGDELAMLAQACKDDVSIYTQQGNQEEDEEEDETDVETCRWRLLVRYASVVFAHALPESNLQWIVVSDGARGTFGIWRAPVAPVRPTDNHIISSSPSVPKLSCWHISPPPIDTAIVNPIGAGDTLAGVLLRTLKLEHTNDPRAVCNHGGAACPQAILSPANMLPACAIGTAAATESCLSKIAAEFDLAKVQKKIGHVRVVQRC